MPPVLTRLLCVLRVGLIVLLIFSLLREIFKVTPSVRSRAAKPMKAAMIAAICHISALAFPTDTYAQFPSESLLTDLESRMTRESPCFPSCAEVSKGTLSARGGNLDIRLIIDAAQDVSFPLPGHRDGWMAEKIRINGVAANALRTDAQGTLHCVLSRGRSVVELSGSLTATESEIRFPQTVHNASIQSSDWIADGIEENTIKNGSVRLTAKTTQPASQDARSFAPQAISPFVMITRTITLGKEWKLHLIKG